MAKLIFALFITVSMNCALGQGRKNEEVKILHHELVNLIVENSDLKAQLDSIKVLYEKQNSGFYVRLVDKKDTLKSFNFLITLNEEGGQKIYSLSSIKNPYEAFEISNRLRNLDFYDYKVIFKGSYFDNEFMRKRRTRMEIEE